MTDISLSVTQKNISLLKLLEVINNKPAGISFIVDDSNKLCGVVTDGDVRRWLLGGYQLDSKLTDIELDEFVYATVSDSVEDIIALTTDRIRIIPIVNKNFEIVDYFQHDKRIYLPVAAPDLGGNELKYVTDSILSTWISSTGKYIDRFENEFTEYCGVNYGVSTSNGTVALHLALLTLGVGPGDEVIVPDLTFAATINAVLHSGATPVIVDVEESSWCIDPSEIKKSITSKTKAIIPVHLYGLPCDMDRIMKIAREYKLFVIEDCAQAHGATYKGRKVGSFGDINTFSFFANKIITTGEGGMCLTNVEQYNKRMRVLRDHGMNKEKRYWHDEVGYNYRMTNMQAAIGCAQLERIDQIIAFRKTVEKNYTEILSKNLKVTPQIYNGEERVKVVWLVSLLLESGDKENLIQFFKENGIDIRPFFYPLSEMPVYQKYYSSKSKRRNSMKISEKGISLPTHSAVNEERFEEINRLFKKTEFFDINHRFS